MRRKLAWEISLPSNTAHCVDMLVSHQKQHLPCLHIKSFSSFYNTDTKGKAEIIVGSTQRSKLREDSISTGGKIFKVERGTESKTKHS